MQDLPPALITALREAGRVVALTGCSSISAESGVPTFREVQTGLWARYDRQQLVTPEASARDCCLVWNGYEWRKDLVGGAEPNSGHSALTELERQVPGFTLVTHNVDGSHARAGSRNVVELHGNILRSTCSLDGEVFEPEDHDASVPPRCPRCGAYLRPEVVWFGEMLPAEAFATAFQAARRCDLFLSIGTLSLDYPAAGMPYEILGPARHLSRSTP